MKCLCVYVQFRFDMNVKQRPSAPKTTRILLPKCQFCYFPAPFLKAVKKYDQDRKIVRNLAVWYKMFSGNKNVQALKKHLMRCSIE